MKKDNYYKGYAFANCIWGLMVLGENISLMLFSTFTLLLSLIGVYGE